MEKTKENYKKEMTSRHPHMSHVTHPSSSRNSKFYNIMENLGRIFLMSII